MGRRIELPRHKAKWMRMLPQPLALPLARYRVVPRPCRHIHHHTLARMGIMYLSMFTPTVTNVISQVRYDHELDSRLMTVLWPRDCHPRIMKNGDTTQMLNVQCALFDMLVNGFCQPTEYIPPAPPVCPATSH